MDYILLMTKPFEYHYIVYCNSCRSKWSWEHQNSAHRWLVHKILQSLKVKTFFLHIRSAIFHGIFFFWAPMGQNIYYRFVRIIFIISYYATGFKVKISLDHFGWWKFFKKNLLIFEKNNIFISMAVRFFVSSLHFMVGPISY